MKHIAVFGTGYVGLVTGAGLSDFGNRVICVDIDADKIEGLKNGIIPIYEPGLKELVERNMRSNRLAFSTDILDAISQAEVIFIAVGTPPRADGQANLEFVESVARSIAEHATDYKVIVTKSTVPVGTGQLIENLLKENARPNLQFDVVSNPEFLREGSAIEDFMRPNRVVIGTRSERAAQIMHDVYRPLYINETPIISTDVESAEIIKYASNAFLATKITFINEVANLCEAVGADVHKVALGMGSDLRIGKKFLHPGPGYGGSCFPKDTSALVQIAQKFGSPVRIVETVIDVNHQQKLRMVDKIIQTMGDVNGKTIAILGLAFKPNTDDMREAASLTILPQLIERGARIRAFDPVAMDNAKPLLPPSVEYFDNAYDTADGADALVILTEWNEFRELNFKRLKTLLKAPLVVDCRNLYEPKIMADMGYQYECIGRGTKKDLHNQKPII